ncbi:bestrophin-4-like [Chrysoperla carnea]|uniref:bestrophin-4-like n=1 Tax=Chrysoperla carnea TaxID=189513 RepID=UPI001D0978B9|nr:bestrophin-4-like [Chrysoperla carnea]
MTVTYTAEVATCRWFGCFLKLLVRWRGSIYKLVWMDLIAFLFIYYGLNIAYRHFLNEEHQRTFEAVVRYCKFYNNLIPISFVLGFYVSIVMTRWWNQYNSIPYPDSLAVFVSAHVHGQDERGRVMRRTIMRYVCLCLTKVLTMISPRVKKRFPTLDHFVDAGLLVESEKTVMEHLDVKFPNHSKHWLPIVWASSIVTRARKEGRLRDDFAVKTLIDELNKFRGNAGILLNYDMVSLPLVYTQVVTLAVYSYFLTSAIGRQWIKGLKGEDGNEITNLDMYFPVFTMLEFFFYMGWLKVAESLINPWGDDDDDFEVNWLVDRNLQVSYLIVDEMHHEHPELVKDQYWDQVFPSELPYTLAAEPFRDKHPLPSTANLYIPKNETQIFAPPSSLKIDEMGMGDGFGSYDDTQSGIHFTVGRTRSGSRTNRPPSVGSQSSMGTLMGGSMTRVNSVSGVLRRIFTREDSRTDGASQPMYVQPRLPGSASSTSLKDKGTTNQPPGSIRLATQVIEEVDEQLTIQSMRAKEDRPHMATIFGSPPPSSPIPVPKSNNNHQQHISTSAPAAAHVRGEMDVISIDSGSTNNSVNDDDEFTKLKNTREAERRERLMQKLTKSVNIDDNLVAESFLMNEPLNISPSV